MGISRTDEIHQIMVFIDHNVFYATMHLYWSYGTKHVHCSQLKDSPSCLHPVSESTNGGNEITHYSEIFGIPIHYVLWRRFEKLPHYYTLLRFLYHGFSIHGYRATNVLGNMFHFFDSLHPVVCHTVKVDAVSL